MTLAEQMKQNTIMTKKKKKNTDVMISTGSTLLDLAISGTTIRGGGLSGGIFVEIFGPSGSGKTVLLSEIAGGVQRQGGRVMFHDPEARLDKTFASIFDVDFDKIHYTQPDTVTETFEEMRAWELEDTKVINGIFADSLAALSTNLEMDNAEGDKMGMRRAKEFSEQLRKTCRIIKQKNILFVASNQIRVNADAGFYAEKTTTPGGQAIPFYASVRLRARTPEKLKKRITVKGKEVERVIGIKTTIEVYKNSIDRPYRTAPIYIIFDYGIDDIRANLQFIKDFTKQTIYTVDDIRLDKSMEKSILMVEEQELEKQLQEQVIDLWEEIETKFESDSRSKKRR